METDSAVFDFLCSNSVRIVFLNGWRVQLAAEKYGCHCYTQHPGAARECQGHGWTARNFVRVCHWGFATKLPMAKKRCKYQWSNREQLHDAGYDKCGQRRDI